jgi:hypothetical protein
MRRRLRATTLVTDCLLAGCWGLGALRIVGAKPGLAALLLSAALGALVALMVIEPATARSAFEDDPADRG